jgi:hypothetical protein
VERVTEYRLQLKAGLLGAGKALSADELQAVPPRCCTTA